MLDINKVEDGEAISAKGGVGIGNTFDWSQMYQIGLVVESLDRTASLFQLFGLGELAAQDSRTVVAREIYGSTTKAFAHRTGRFQLTEELEIVVIEPSPEEGPQRNALEKKGAHVFHLCFYTDDIAAAVRRMEELGAAVISWGRFDDGGEYAVFETAEQIGVNLELY